MTELEFINISHEEFLAYKLAKIHEAYAKKKEKRLISEGENRNKIETAKRLHDANASIDIIKTATGFSENQIKNICL